MRFQKISIPTPRKVIGYSKGRGVSKAKSFKGKYEANWNFLRGGGGGGPYQKTPRGRWGGGGGGGGDVHTKKPSMDVGVWIFSRTKHYDVLHFSKLSLHFFQALKDNLRQRFPGQVFDYSCQYDGIDESSGRPKVSIYSGGFRP